GDPGSPRVVGSTSASRSASRVGSPAFARAGSCKSPLAPRPRPPNPRGRLILRQFLQTAPDRARRHAGRHRHRGNATISRGKRLRRRDQTTAPFIKKRRHRQKPLSNGLNIDHDHHIWYEKTVVNSIFTLSQVDSIISGRALSISALHRVAAGLVVGPDDVLYVGVGNE